MRNSRARSLWNLRYPIFWSTLAASALAILATVVVTQDRQTLLRWSVFLFANPQQGSAIFREKGCLRCHSVNGVGGKVGPDLAGAGGHPSDLAFLVTAMWNHAPNMWERMRVDHVSYPTLTYEETAQLMAYLYTASHMDGPGNSQNGKRLFTSKGCILCHAVTNRNGEQRSLWTALGAADTPMAWTEAMWKGAPTMDDAMRKAGLTWPMLDGSDLNDLLAFVQQSSGHHATGAQYIPGDPDRGWKVFQDKSCITCHELKQDGSSLQPAKWLARTFSQVGELMWNRVPEMRRAMQSQDIANPTLTNEEMTDLIAFIYSLRYFDPPGSSVVGRSIFNWRGCSLCHGEDAQGTTIAPALRGRGRNYNSISLATALWSHGRKMYYLTQKSGLDWPTLQENDIGDLLEFLNSPIAQFRAQGQD
jgi:mono/diheme cytochrome c family protein